MTLPSINFDPALFFTPERVVWPANWAGHVPFAAWLVAKQRPYQLVELGTHNGFSYGAFCQAVKEQGTPTHCHAVDTWQGDEHAGYYGEHIYQELKGWHDARYSAFSSLHRTTFDKAVALLDNSSVDLLHIDGLHTYEAVRHDFYTWLPKLSSRAVVLFHDTQVHRADFGVWQFWEEIAAEYPHFSFTHCNGLGVLLVGHEQPFALQVLSDAPAQDQATLRQLFAQIGGNVEQQAYAAEIQRQLQQQHEAYKTELALLYDSLENAHKNTQQLLTSKSWRITRPLRAMAQWLP